MKFSNWKKKRSRKTSPETPPPVPADGTPSAPEAKEGTKKRKFRLIDVLYAVSGTFVCVCYLGYLVMILAQGAPLTLPVPLAVFSLVLLPVLFRKKLRKRLPRAFPHLKRFFCAGMCFYMVTFCIFSGVILFYGHSLPEREAVEEGETPVIVVFGCRSYGRTPGTTLRNRLNVAAALMEEFPEALCVVSGSQGSNETLPEAEAMYAYLTETKGFPENRVLREPEGTDSVENLSFSLDLLEEKGITPTKIFCVSSEFHTPRILLIASHMGIGDKTVVVSAPSDGVGHLFTSLVREYMAYVKMFLFREV